MGMQEPRAHGAVAGEPLRVDVALSPIEVQPRARQTCIVVDVIRATTTLSVCFERGVGTVWLAPNIAAARRAYAHWEGPKPLLAGELRGVRPTGFDLGNSPAEYAAADLEGRELLYVTTNGTRAVHACVRSGAVFCGALRNASAVAAAALQAARARRALPPPSSAGEDTEDLEDPEDSEELRELDDLARPPDLLVVCAGRAGRFAIDDVLVAAHLVRVLVAQAEAAGVQVKLRDGAGFAEAELEMAEERGTLREALAESQAARALEPVGLRSDLEWCTAVDVSRAVPRVRGRKDARGLVRLALNAEDASGIPLA